MLSTLRKNLEKKLRGQGLSLRATDLAALVEGLAPRSSRTALSYALDFLRPFSAGMGFRITRLSDEHVELVVPARRRNQDEDGRIHEGALLTGALEAARLLWLRHAPLGGLKVYLVRGQFQVLQDYTGDIRVRMELPETQCESVLAQLRAQQQAESEVSLHFFDEKEKSVASTTMVLQLKHIPGLNAP